MTPRLGFGTAPILGRVDGARSRRALAIAYETGVRHIDTARSYGWGEAEGLIGAFLGEADRRDVCLVTKCGIVPAKRSMGLSAMKGAARTALRMAPGLSGLVRRTASLSAFQPVSTYDLAALQRSFEASLAALRTDRVHALLLHSFTPDGEGLADVLEWFTGLQRSGRVGDYGFCVEGDLLEGLERLKSEGALGGVVQAPVTDQMLSLSPVWSGLRIVAHSPFRYLTLNDGRSGRAGLAGLLEAFPSHLICEAVVCSMYSEAHIRANVDAWRRATGVAADRSPQSIEAE